MRETRLKGLMRSLFFPCGSLRKILFGPLRGMLYRVGPVTGLSPFYSGTERNEQKIFKSIIKKGDVVFDVGANWGVHTLYFSKLVGSEGRVFSMEPGESAFHELEWHIEGNNLKNVRAFKIALNKEDGESLLINGEATQTNTLLSALAHAQANQKMERVKVRTLDSLMKECDLKQLNLIKLDVEGSEHNVLLGSENTINHYRPYWIIELHTPEQDVKVSKFLISKGYEISRIGNPPIKRFDVGWPEKDGVWGTILAKPSIHV